MKKYNHLLQRAADEFSIAKGYSEDERAWKARIVYSIVGRLAFASLWDTTEEESVSITHFKQRAEKLLNNYIELYPELKSGMVFPNDLSEVSKEYYDIYTSAGVIYHEANRITPSIMRSAVCCGVDFTRGYPLGEKQSLSGLGTYRSSDQNLDAWEDLADLFNVEMISNKELWEHEISNISWISDHSLKDAQYLKTNPPFTRGYWMDQPEQDGGISILRIGERGNYLYFYYKMEDTSLLISPIQQWKVDGAEYRSLSTACLSDNGTLPPTKYRIDGDIVHISFGYLPPPAELTIWKLYSWPKSCNHFPADFNRICNIEVFKSIRFLMEQKGFMFMED